MARRTQAGTSAIAAYPVDGVVDRKLHDHVTYPTFDSYAGIGLLQLEHHLRHTTTTFPRDGVCDSI
jgi:hypothetical protein